MRQTQGLTGKFMSKDGPPTAWSTFPVTRATHAHICTIAHSPTIGFQLGEISSKSMWTGDLSYLNHVSLPNSPSSNSSFGKSNATMLEHLPAEHRYNHNKDDFSNQLCLLHHQRTIYDINLGFPSQNLPPDHYDPYHEVSYSPESVQDSHYCQHPTDDPLTTWDSDLHIPQYMSEFILGSVSDQDAEYSGPHVMQATSSHGLTMPTVPSQPQDFYTISAQSFGPDPSWKHSHQASSLPPPTPRSHLYSPTRVALAAVSHPTLPARPCSLYSLTLKTQPARTPTDLYTPRLIRGAGRYREGLCSLCRPARWLLLKNSAFWYDKTFGHGISAVTGEYFDGPKEVRVYRGNTIGLGSALERSRCNDMEVCSGHEDVDMGSCEERKLGYDGRLECGNEKQQKEGLCGTCGAWVVLGSGRKGKVLGMSWFRHAYKVIQRLRITPRWGRLTRDGSVRTEFTPARVKLR